MDLQLAGKKVLITGASKGIGLACARIYAREGAHPILVARSEDALASAADSIRKETGATVKTVVADLSKRGAAVALADKAGDVDILVNNAGAIPGGSVEQIDDAKWRESWELKVFGYIDLVRTYLPRMKARKSGVIANVIGMAGVSPKYDYICGGAANASLIAFTSGVGGSSPQFGVRVFGVNPAATRTDRITLLTKQRAKTTLGDESRWEELLKDLPFGRLMEADEVANLVVFGSSPMSGYLSGTVINLDGGQLFAPPKR